MTHRAFHINFCGVYVWSVDRKEKKEHKLRKFNVSIF